MDETSPKSDWLITTNRYVAYFDVMGFKEMVLRTPHDEVYEMMKNIRKTIEEKRQEMFDLSKERIIEITTYSDSIIVYSKDETSLGAFIYTISALTGDLLSEGIPHKGAAAFGKMTVDTEKSIFFGQPLIDAYLLQEELAFYGVVAHGTLEQEITATKGLVLALTTNYPCQFKRGNAKHVVICPIWVSGIPTVKECVDQVCESVKRMRYKASGSVRSYIDNTESYICTLKELWYHD